MRASDVTIAPTLETMAGIYRLTREGRAKSPRFVAYLAHAEREWGFSAYNPMAGPPALDLVKQLLSLGAEGLAQDSAQKVVEQCEFHGPITLAVVVASPGMWTDRIATEVQHRMAGKHTNHSGTVLCWPGEPVNADTIRRESIAEAVRTMWTRLRGPAVTLQSVLSQEGLAYALHPEPFAGLVGEAGDGGVSVEQALTVLGDSPEIADIVGVMYGDEAARHLGWTPLGVADHAGYRWAVARAVDAAARIGAPALLHRPWSAAEVLKT